MKRLNPNDNQGIRYVLINELLELDFMIAAKRLLEEYDEGSAFWLYSEALFKFKTGGKSKEANDMLKAAIRSNKFIPQYLRGKKRLSKYLPEEYSWGSEEEAQIYFYQAKDLWKNTVNALGWLTNQ